MPDLEKAVRDEVLRLAGEVAGTVGIVVPAARRAEVNSWLASWPELAEDAPSAAASVAGGAPAARTGSWC